MLPPRVPIRTMTMNKQMHTQADLGSFKKNIYSQFGEDGVIEEILKRISSSASTNGWCVEFGAWDGIHLSNTCNLIRNKNYKAVLIEGDKDKHEQLKTNIPQDDVWKFCRFVTFEGEDTLDGILSTTPIPEDFDFLSIDIDGCDYYIFDSLTQYRPKIICIEFNPTIPNEVEFVQPKDFRTKQGASAKSIIKLGNKKNYSLVAVTECNVFMVRKDYQEIVIGREPADLNQLRSDTRSKVFLFVGFDGTILSNKEELYLEWHEIPMKTNCIQYLPRYLRTYPLDYTLPQKLLFTLWLAFRDPRKFLSFLRKKFKALG